jgi:hypothetical protein
MDPIVIESLIVKTSDSRVRVLLGDHCLDFNPDDVLGLEELPPPGGLIPGSAVFARISIRAGARLMGMVSAKDYQPILWAWRNPFVFATRTVLHKWENEDFGVQEQDFYRLRGIDATKLPNASDQEKSRKSSAYPPVPTEGEIKIPSEVKSCC